MCPSVERHGEGEHKKVRSACSRGFSFAKLAYTCARMRSPQILKSLRILSEMGWFVQHWHRRRIFADLLEHRMTATEANKIPLAPNSTSGCTCSTTRTRPNWWGECCAAKQICKLKHVSGGDPGGDLMLGVSSAGGSDPWGTESMCRAPKTRCNEPPERGVLPPSPLAGVVRFISIVCG